MLKDPFPSSPHKDPRYSLMALRRVEGEESIRTHAVCFTEAYAAVIWLREMIAAEDTVLETGDTLVTPLGLKVRSMQMSKILEYEMTTDESSWELPTQYMMWIKRFRLGTWFEAKEEPKNVTVIESEVVKKQIAVAKARAPDGWISITSICEGTSIKPMHARAALRASRPKPEFGWSFAPPEVPAIKKLIGL